VEESQGLDESENESEHEYHSTTMPTPVLMPQMGESIAEGTIVRWIKKVGEKVDRDEPLFEISTDKVDAEIPSPVAGVLSAIAVREGETVPVNSIVATIGDADTLVVEVEPVIETDTAGNVSSSSAMAAAPPVHPPAPAVPAPANGQDGTEDPRRAKSSPLVRKIAKEHNVDIRDIPGSGVGGRVTKHDILGFLDHRPASPAQAPGSGGHVPVYRPGEHVEIVPLSVMRKKIAEHMVLSRRTSAHVHSVFEVNFHRVAQLRDRYKTEYEQQGAKLTYLPFILKAVADALRALPIVNASLDGDNVVYKKDINIGVAVALDWGLIVPVVKNADAMNVLDLTKAVTDLAGRARVKQLKPEDVQGGTFTVTNPGIFGAQFGMPIINQPQVAILGVGAVEKRVVVVDDAIAIRPMAYLTLGFDHRLIDGAIGDQFMSVVKRQLENFDPAAV
jgi:2-oxoglutarate dehydrogenase E2 component (dihydrolipoamide succinyltransferase)